MLGVVGDVIQALFIVQDVIFAPTWVKDGLFVSFPNAGVDHHLQAPLGCSLQTPEDRSGLPSETKQASMTLWVAEIQKRSHSDTMTTNQTRGFMNHDEAETRSYKPWPGVCEASRIRAHLVPLQNEIDEPWLLILKQCHRCKGGACPSSFHITVEGPTEEVSVRWMCSLTRFLHGIRMDNVSSSLHLIS